MSTSKAKSKGKPSAAQNAHKSKRAVAKKTAVSAKHNANSKPAASVKPVEAHGVRRRLPGTQGDLLWVEFDKLSARLGAPIAVTLDELRKTPLEKKFNPTTVMLAYYQWRRFHGIRGRGKKQKIDA